MADLSTTGAAALLGVSPESVRVLADSGALPHRRTRGGHRRFAESDVLVYRAQGTALPAAPAVRVRVWTTAALALLAEAEADLGSGSPMAESFRRASQMLRGS